VGAPRACCSGITLGTSFIDYQGSFDTPTRLLEYAAELGNLLRVEGRNSVEYLGEADLMQS
jgi:hypothetical protein